MNFLLRAGAITLMVAFPVTSSGQVVDFVETFDADTAGWMNVVSDSLDLVGSGGPDGSSYASTEINFEFFPDGSGMGGGQPAVSLFRGQDEFGSSGGAFEGNWITSNVDQITFEFRHNLPTPANVFARFSGPANFPGALYVDFTPTFANQWTQISVDIDQSSFVSFEGTDFESVFTNVGHLQFGVTVPVGLGETTTDYRFDLDNVSVTTVPEPSSLILLGLATLALVNRRQNRCQCRPLRSDFIH